MTASAAPIAILPPMTQSTKSPPGIPIWLILVVAAAAGIGAYLGQLYWAPQNPEGSTLQPVSASGQFLRYPQPKVVDPVTLTGSDGADFPLTQLKGRWTLAFFGFTHCPDACPTALAMLKSAANVWSRLPIERQPQILFVSVDPERDTPEVLDRYVHFFNPDFIAATADHSILLPWTRSLGVVYDQVPDADGGGSYTVDHSTSILVFNPELQMIGMLRPPHTAAQIVEDLAPVLESVQP